MKLGDLLSGAKVGSAFRNSGVWNQDVEAVRAESLSLAAKTLSSELGDDNAALAFDAVMEELQRSFIFGDHTNVDVLKARYPSKPLSTQELLNLLEKLTPVEGKAVLYMMVENLKIEDIVILSRQSAKDSAETELGKLIIDKTVPHFKSALLFWKLTPSNGPATLSDLSSKLETLSHRSVTDLRFLGHRLLTNLTADQDDLLLSWLS